MCDRNLQEFIDRRFIPIEPESDESESEKRFQNSQHSRLEVSSKQIFRIFISIAHENLAPLFCKHFPGSLQIPGEPTNWKLADFILFFYNSCTLVLASILNSFEATLKVRTPTRSITQGLDALKGAAAPFWPGYGIDVT